MKIINAPFLQCDSVEEYKEVFVDQLVKVELFLEGYRLLVLAKDFAHACYERGPGNIEKSIFSPRRARRMLFISSICKREISYKIVLQKERTVPSVCLLCEDLETAIYLMPLKTKSGSYLKLMTLIAFGDGVTKRIQKQLDEGEIVESLEGIWE